MGCLICKKQGSKDAVCRTRDWDRCGLKFSLKLAAVDVTSLNERARLEERRGIRVGIGIGINGE